MKVLIISDSHGRNRDVEAVINQVGDVDMMVHLGDVECSAELIRSMARCPADKVYIVRGNNDFSADLPMQQIIDINGYRTLITHGHRYFVSGGTSELEQYCRENDIAIAMYGHTHVPDVHTTPDGITVINPGSISFPRQDGRKKTFATLTFDQYGHPLVGQGELK